MTMFVRSISLVYQLITMGKGFFLRDQGVWYLVMARGNTRCVGTLLLLRIL